MIPILPTLSLIVLLALAPPPAPGAAARGAKPPDEVRVTVVQTTDVHGRLAAWDYFRSAPADLGLTRVAAFVRQARQENPNLLLIDNGDTIQGSPLAYYYAMRRSGEPNPIIAAMNAMGYDAMTVGNHEYNFGLDVLLRCRREARFPMLSANTYPTGEADKPFFEPYIVRRVGPVRIGVLGLTTRNIPNWETPANYAGLEFRDTLAEAARWVKILREREQVDAVIVSTHEGYEVDLETGESNGSEYENRAWAILQAVPGIDILLTGHSHENIPPRLVNGVLTAQGHRWSEHVTRLDLVFRKQGAKWALAVKSGANVPMKGPEDPAIAALAGPAHEATLQWLDETIGVAEDDLTAEGVYVRDNALLDLVHAVMREHTGAQLSMAAYLPGRPVKIPRGDIKVRDVYALYIYENTTVTLGMPGKDVAAALEHAARVYDRVEWDPAKNIFRLAQEPEFRLYNFDTLSGADYAIDPTRPPGERLLYLYHQNRPVDPEAEYTVAVTNYQAVGGGRYEMFRRGRRIAFDSQDIRTLIIDYIRRRGRLAVECDHNWHLAVPVEFQPASRRPAAPAAQPAGAR
jgi:2',3'-cyclic-nucleotide 2'-phosphodiesterase/3'-nucleotidase